MLDAEPDEVPRICEFLSYIKTPGTHAQFATGLLKMIGTNSVRHLLTPKTGVMLFLADRFQCGQILNRPERLPSAVPRLSPVSSPVISPRRQRHAAVPLGRRTAKTDALKFDSADIAAQLTLMVHEHYSKISSNELIALAKDDPPTSDVHNLSEYSRFNRKLAKTVKYIVLTADSLTERRAVLLGLIKVAEVCFPDCT